MKNKKNILMIILLVFLTVSVSAGPILYNAYIDTARLGSSNELTYEPYVKKGLSAEEFALLYSKGQIANNSSLLNAINESVPEAETVRKELREILRKVFEKDSYLLERVLKTIEAPMEEYEEDTILFVNDSHIMTFGIVTAFFINGDSMLKICYEKSTGVVVTADYREFETEDNELVETCDKALNYYYCEILKLNIERYYFSPLIFNGDTWCQFGLRQGTMSDIEIQYYN